MLSLSLDDPHLNGPYGARLMSDHIPITKADLARQALKLPRPWIDGGVTADDWCEAVDVIAAVSGKSLLRAPSSAPVVDPREPAPRGFKPRGIA